jgi:Flp pilus assembly protein TadB
MAGMSGIGGIGSISPLLGWALAVLAVAVGYAVWGWAGVALAVTVVVFWLLLQFSRALRVLRAAGSRPLGHVESALMLHSKLSPGLQMMQVVQLTKSLGERVREEPETWRWHDEGGDAVEVELAGGRVRSWQLLRNEAAPPT